MSVLAAKSSASRLASLFRHCQRQKSRYKFHLILSNTITLSNSNGRYRMDAKNNCRARRTRSIAARTGRQTINIQILQCQRIRTKYTGALPDETLPGARPLTGKQSQRMAYRLRAGAITCRPCPRPAASRSPARAYCSRYIQAIARKCGSCQKKEMAKRHQPSCTDIISAPQSNPTGQRRQRARHRADHGVQGRHPFEWCVNEHITYGA